MMEGGSLLVKQVITKVMHIPMRARQLAAGQPAMTTRHPYKYIDILNFLFLFFFEASCPSGELSNMSLS